MKRLTMADIAREAGVSKGAVSYALNGLPGVSDKTRRRILDIAERHGFTPNSAARALTGSPAGAIGLVLCRPARTLGVEPFFMELISGIEGELSARSIALSLQVVKDHEAEIAVYHRWWAERRVDGVLVVDVRTADARLDAVRRLRLPAVVIAGPADFDGLPSVWSDDGAAITEAVEYLYALGHRRIARVGGLPDLLHTAVRTAAFQEVCARLGFTRAETVLSDYTGEEGDRVTRRLLISADRPTAIIYDNDVMAVAGLAVAQEMGVSVPGELSLVAWGGSLLCGMVHPPLTALTRDVAGYGANAARRLLTLLEEGTVDSYQDTTAHLVPRGSTGPVPSRPARRR
ncbi:DNA-binding LacI/PurR family transcriptional regulator [Catenuloplanes nepalensis]|uniref:DNA-binding LacI/PurR family transcriptional regulator n=1 Tax=Catenuloplanes nepalensis TaxID=587533 RepID=A0ABT9MRT8_9ACTN|nr:LacI family DNA-binding transcriptional regulator [Catenuloplanes nepalensis]MDP9794140.1 DNA-binding LacI/PurR family transcriptional regulator [Catenuloplanes nepalensis]